MKFKKQWILAAAMAGLLSAPAMTSAVHADSPNSVCSETCTLLPVSGTATQTVSPDYAVVSLGVTTKAASVTAAKSQNDAIMGDLVAKLQGLGIHRNDIQTTDFSISPEYTGHGERGIHQYVVNNNLSVKVNDLDKVSRVIDKAAEIGVNTINSLDFFSKKSQSLDDTLTKEAVADARHRAEVIANALGLHIVGVKEISTDRGYTQDNLRYAKMNFAAISTSTPIEKGQLMLTKTIRITYKLQ